jgi:sugar phosphate isomerase/epimerase
MIRIACQTITWGPERNRQNTTDVFSEVARAGYSGVEIGARHLAVERAGEYEGALKWLGLQLVALHVGGDFLDRASVAAQVQSIGGSIRLARVLGAPYVVVSGTYRASKTIEDYRFEAGTYNTLGTQCCAEGLRLLYHNHDWEIANGMEGLHALLSYTDPDLVGFVPDVGWVARAGGDPVALIRRLGARVQALHFKEFTSEGEFTELGRGIVDFSGCFAAVRQRSDFWIVCEQDRTKKNPFESAEHNYRFVRTLSGNEPG